MGDLLGGAMSALGGVFGGGEEGGAVPGTQKTTVVQEQNANQNVNIGSGSPQDWIMPASILGGLVLLAVVIAGRK